MKLGFMSFSTPNLTLEEMLALASSLGYHGVEPRLDSGHGHGIEVTLSAEARRAVRDAAKRAGVEYACVATSVRLANPETSQAAIESAHEAIDLAGDIGAPCIRVFGGKFAEHVSREAAMDQAVKSLMALADHAGERRVLIAVETHDAWCDPRHVAEVLTRVNHRSVGANWDVMHPVRHGYATIEESFNILKPWIYHLHVHDCRIIAAPEAEIVPMGTGDVDHAQVARLLKANAYKGFLSGEWIQWGKEGKDHLEHEVAELQRYVANA